VSGLRVCVCVCVRVCAYGMWVAVCSGYVAERGSGRPVWLSRAACANSRPARRIAVRDLGSVEQDWRWLFAAGRRTMV
jgi:hypothetical protein